MPKYTYFCQKCDYYFQKIVSYDDRNKIKCNKCGDNCILKPPIPLKNIVNDLVDPYRNKAIKKNINEIMKKRQMDFVVENELGEMIEKHGLKTIKKTSYWKNRRKKIV